MAVVGIFIMIFNFAIFIFVARVIFKNIINFNNIASDSNIAKRYREMNGETKEKYNRIINKDFSVSKSEGEAVTFDSSFKLDNNPIKEKRKR